MKKFLIICTAVVVLLVAADVAVNRLGLFIDLNPSEPVATFVKVEKKTIYLKRDGQYEEFVMKGVNVGAGIPGDINTEIDSATYLKWFSQIQEMGANTIRVNMIMNDVFYNAFYEYNQNHVQNPLYIIQGISVSEYNLNSRLDAFNEELIQPVLTDVKDAVDIIHGSKKLSLGKGRGSGTYKKDISEWVLGYTIGIEWKDETVVYTDDIKEARNSYQGKYLYTTQEASAFEAFLTCVGDQMISYETAKYKTQRLVAFSNSAITDPFHYPESIEDYFKKIANIDVEHIGATEKFQSGCFAAYQVSPYYPAYFSYYDMLREPLEIDKEKFTDSDGVFNSYLAYLTTLNEYHTIPVIITEYGVPSSRGISQPDNSDGRTQGRLNEREQAEALVKCYNDIMASGCAGSIVYNWQDEWFKGVWNTMNYVDLEKTYQWSDYQTSSQSYGLLSFDPGEDTSISYVDGNITEWSEDNIVAGSRDRNLSMKYDEKFVYFKIHKDSYDIEQDVLYIPLDITPKSGSTYCEEFSLKFERETDFILIIDGKENSRLMVQERYEALPPVFWAEARMSNPYDSIPDKYSPQFKPINMIAQVASFLTNYLEEHGAVVYETGKLKYGNANPESADYDSLADFCVNGDEIEIKIPWLLLNFSNPSEMKIQDDYYENYGVEEIKISEIFVGIGTKLENERIQMNSFKLKGWGNKPTYHERLKPSYHLLKELWTKEKK